MFLTPIGTIQMKKLPTAAAAALLRALARALAHEGFLTPMAATGAGC